MPVTYCLRWNDLRKKPLNLLDEDEARRLHDAGQPYVAYVHDVPGRGDALVEMALFSPSVAVYFLDERRQRTMYHAFKSDGSGGLFLDEMGWRSFQRDGQICLVESHRFLPDEGLILITRYDAGTEIEESSKQKLSDTAPLMEHEPAFGKHAA
ncbi:MAG: hypothetical protein KY439_11025, partial [Actinobacteria bacterium]|nr:hypothetical protein [Actinomycetota bacterium]